jgi:hypothetical protein
MSVSFGPRRLGKMTKDGVQPAEAGISHLSVGTKVDVYKNGELIAKNAVISHMPLNGAGVIDANKPIEVKLMLGVKDGDVLLVPERGKADEGTNQFGAHHLPPGLVKYEFTPNHR